MNVLANSRRSTLQYGTGRSQVLRKSERVPEAGHNFRVKRLLSDMSDRTELRDGKPGGENNTAEPVGAGNANLCCQQVPPTHRRHSPRVRLPLNR